jgi:hypothetical protein
MHATHQENKQPASRFGRGLSPGGDGGGDGGGGGGGISMNVGGGASVGLRAKQKGGGGRPVSAPRERRQLPTAAAAAAIHAGGLGHGGNESNVRGGNNRRGGEGGGVKQGAAAQAHTTRPTPAPRAKQGKHISYSEAMAASAAGGDPWRERRNDWGVGGLLARYTSQPAGSSFTFSPPRRTPLDTADHADFVGHGGVLPHQHVHPMYQQQQIQQSQQSQVQMAQPAPSFLSGVIEAQQQLNRQVCVCVIVCGCMHVCNKQHLLRSQG